MVQDKNEHYFRQLDQAYERVDARRLANLSDRFEAALARITCTCGHKLDRHNENGCTADVIVNDVRRTCLCGFLDNPEVR